MKSTNEIALKYHKLDYCIPSGEKLLLKVKF